MNSAIHHKIMRNKLRILNYIVMLEHSLPQLLCPTPNREGERERESEKFNKEVV